MTRVEAELIKQGLESIARSITGLTVSMMSLASTIELHPLRARVAELQPADVAVELLKVHTSSTKEALNDFARRYS